MEKVRTEKVEKEKRIHEFYCDDCGRKIYESLEYEYGYYHQPLENIITVSVDLLYAALSKRTIRKVMRKCLCEECEKKFIEKVEKDTSKLGLVSVW